ncbi:MAG: valine--tRNA ligase [archaeon]
MKGYNPQEAEPRIQKFWEKEKIFRFDPKSKSKIFSIDTPPPTVSGKMHIGHAFSFSQQDFIARYKRMKGFSIFYPFGTDDNGLATIRLIEKEKKVNSFNLGREKFVKIVLDTLEKELRPKYLADWKRLGMSCDFDIFYTTIDKHCQKISQRSFIQLYNTGREYRKRTPFFWCPECQTAIAQVEMKDKEQESQFVYMKFDTTLGRPIVIATTRPELMPACVAVHVNPKDKRYKDYIGEEAIIPFFNRKVKIETSEDADPDFGSGAVYHCTFGDMDDVEWLEKKKIKAIEVLNKDGTLNKLAGRYSGLKVREARKRIIEDLKKEGRIDKIEPITHAVKVHERCDHDIEILMTDQWFIKYLDLKKEMLEWGKKLNWHPEFMKVRFDNWVKGLKWDWCISRQRFFGIPIPVWYCKMCGEIITAAMGDLPVDPLKDSPKKPCPKCGSKAFIPEEDVLDTWATSSLTPQIAIELMPKDVQKKLFPMSLRPQAHDIITFWLFNTVVKSQLHEKKNPWGDCMISGFVLDPERHKMSKSKGNVVEPQEVFKKYSADTLRYWAAASKLGDDLPYQEKDLVTGNKFITKIVNATNFVFMQIKQKPNKPTDLLEVDRLFLTKLNELVRLSTEAFDSYEYSKARLATDKFFWQQFTSNYLELVKERVYQGGKKEKESALYVLYESLLGIIKLMAPIIPFITEELYQEYFKKYEGEKSVHICCWPEEISVKQKKTDKEVFDLLNEVIDKVRQEKAKNQKSIKAEIILSLEKKSQDKLKDVLTDLKSVLTVKEIKEGKFKVEFV